ncbi:MAG: glycosyltransferase family 1 protein [Candidatus Peribacteraceae bacterium]|nr:glycosyltransferase family 1 protein [Candidatus Peribacteraceae bacterium]
MKIAIDAREAFKANKAGKGQWTAGFLRELQTRDLDVTVLNDDSFKSGLRWHFAAAKKMNTENFDVYISPTSFIVPHILEPRVACIPIIHDLIAFKKEPHERKAKFIEKLLIKDVTDKAAHICTVSETTKSDLIKKFPKLNAENITTIYAGPMQPNVKPNKPDGRTILCVGTLCPRKNQLRLIKAYASLPEHLRRDYRLLIVGSRGWHDSEIIKFAQQTKGVEWRDYVPDAEYQTLLKTATILAFPSLYEGFGMQVLDALQRGIPVLTSDRGSLGEVVGSAAVTIDPESEKSIADGITSLLENNDLYDQMVEAGPTQAAQFSWKRTVDLFLEAMEKAVQST